MLEIRRSPVHGRGLFTTADVDAGEVLETVPLLVLDEHDTATVTGTVVGRYVVAWGEHLTAVAFGFLSLCNHADDPNAELQTADDLPIGPVASLVALRPIAADEEITIDYGDDHPITD